MFLEENIISFFQTLNITCRVTRPPHKKSFRWLCIFNKVIPNSWTGDFLWCRAEEAFLWRPRPKKPWCKSSNKRPEISTRLTHEATVNAAPFNLARNNASMRTKKLNCVDLSNEHAGAKSWETGSKKGSQRQKLSFYFIFAFFAMTIVLGDIVE